jgi:hypothetical protein
VGRPGLIRQLASGRVVWTRDQVDIRFPLPAVGVALAALMALLGLAAGATVLFVAGVIIVMLGFVNFVGLRVEANSQGITVRNWLARDRLAWSEIAEVAVRVKFSGTYLEIVRSDRRVVRPWATRGGRAAGYSYGDLDEIARRLEAMRRDGVGEQDPPDLALALRLAENGDADLLDQMLAAGTIDSFTYTERLHALAAEGKVDLERLRARRRAALDLPERP